MNTTILMDLGKVIERSLTMEPDDFKINLLRHDHPEKIHGTAKPLDDDYHRFMKLNNNICMRS